MRKRLKFFLFLGVCLKLNKVATTTATAEDLCLSYTHRAEDFVVNNHNQTHWSENVWTFLDPKIIDRFCQKFLEKPYLKKIVRPKRQAIERISDNTCSKFAVFLTDFQEYLNLKSFYIFLNFHDSQARKRLHSIIRCPVITRNIPLSVNLVGQLNNLKLSVKSYQTGYVFLSNVPQESIYQALKKHTFLLIKDSQQLRKVIQEAPLELDSNVYIYEEKPTGYKLSEAYKIDRKMPVIVNPVGFWIMSSGLTKTSQSFWDRRKDLQGLTVSIAAVNYPGWTGIQKSFDGQVKLVGRQPDIWHRLEEASNFTTHFYDVPDAQFGTNTGNGSYSGVIGMLQRGEVMVGINGFTLSAARANVADPLVPLGFFKSKLLYKVKTESDSSIQWSTFAIPLDWQLWSVTILTYFLCTIGISVTIKMGQFKSINERSFVIAQYSFYGQGFPEDILNIPTRIIFLVMCFLGMMFWFSYSAMLISILTAKADKHPFSNLEELLHSTDYRIVTQSGSANIDVFKHGSTIEKEIYNTRMHTVLTIKDTIDELDKANNLVNFVETTAADKIIGLSCKYKWIPRWSKRYQFSFFVQKGSPLKSLFNYHIAKLIESGELSKLEDKWFGSKIDPSCDKAETKPFGMEKVASLFILLFMIFIICLVIFSFECLVKV